MASVLEETAIATRTEHSSELAPTAGAAEKQFEIQSAITVAKRFPRSEDAAFEKLMRSSSRASFAEDAAYSFPRGKETIEGPSVYLAREAARVWGNIRYGLEVIRDDEETRQIRGWAWDLETNLKVTAEDEFKKLIYRKNGGWITPDERDMRELTNRRGAILVRGCILQILPSDLIEDAMARCKSTRRNHAKEDPEGARKKLIMAFSGINVTAEMLAAALGHPIAQCSPSEIADLRMIYKSIADGNSTWAEYVEPQKAEREQGSIKMEDLKPGKEQNRGHGQENLDKLPTQAPAPEPKARGKAAPKPEAKPLDNPNYAEGSDPDPFAGTGTDPFGS